jgi:hypothetical protein
MVKGSDPLLEAIHISTTSQLLLALDQMTERERLAVLRVRFERDLLWFGAYAWGERCCFPPGELESRQVCESAASVSRHLEASQRRCFSNC